MPKIVDHDAQRRRFAEATMRLVARDGLEGVTMRAVAAEAGLSYGSLFHYFESKDDLLLHAVGHSMALQTDRVDQIASRCQGREALEQLLCDDAIISDSSRDAWMMWQSFLYKAALQDSFASMHSTLIESWLARLERLLRDAQSAGELREDLDPELEALALWVYSAGVGQMGLLAPGLLPADRQRSLIAGYLDKLAG